MDKPYRLISIGILAIIFLGVLSSQHSVFSQDLWLMKGHDTRRTGQSSSFGPLSIDPSQTWVEADSAAFVINIGASVDASAAYYGSWGLLRKDTTQSVLFWDKSDGQIFARDLETGQSIWNGAVDLDLVPRCYDYSPRDRTGDDAFWCGLFNSYHVSFYNGTVEGQAAIDTSRGVMYFGRGDGKLYAIDQQSGETRWRYTTYNPLNLADPDGGGEVVTSPLIGPSGKIYFGTWGEGAYETEAIYSVQPDGLLAWRYPADSSLSHRLFASPALSPDGSTIYFSTFVSDSTGLPGYLYALDIQAPDNSGDSERLKWKIPLSVNGAEVITTTIAVTTDGLILVGGLYFDSGTNSNVPVVGAFRDDGMSATAAWDPVYTEMRDGSHLVLGLALREVAGESVRVYATSANLGTPIFNAKVEGALYALSLDGEVLASYDPSDEVADAVGSVNSPAIGADGVVYFGVRGRFGTNAIDGQYFAVRFDETNSVFQRLWNYQVDGHVEWNHPALGPNGALYAGSSAGGSGSTTSLTTYDEGVIPPGSTTHFYKLGGPTAVQVQGTGAPKNSASMEIFPNPARSGATVEILSPRLMRATISVHTITGREIDSELVDVAVGRTRFELDTMQQWPRLASGVYFVRLRLENETLLVLSLIKIR